MDVVIPADAAAVDLVVEAHLRVVPLLSTAPSLLHLLHPQMTMFHLRHLLNNNYLLHRPRTTRQIDLTP